MIESMCRESSLVAAPPALRDLRTSAGDAAHWHGRADRFGAVASLVCAVHCALLPLVLGALPVLGLSFLADHRYEAMFIAFASVLATLMVAYGFRRHRRLLALWLLLPGIALLLAGAFSAFAHGSALHSMLVAVGGVLVAGAHVVNLRLARGCVRPACRVPDVA